MAHNSQYAATLACKIVREQYGEIPETVCNCLIRKGRQSLADVIRLTALSPSLVRQALLILIQQNCVAAYAQKDEETVRSSRPTQYLYEAQMDRILQNLRKARFLLQVREEFEVKTEDGVAVNTSDLAEAIIDLLLQHGRLRVDQLVPATISKLGLPEEGDLQERVRNVFMQLVHARYVERAPPASLPPPKAQVHPNAVRLKRGAKAGSSQAAAEAAAAARSLEEAGYEKERFRLTTDLILDGPSSMDVDPEPLPEGSSKGASKAAKKRRRDAPERVGKASAAAAAAAASGAPTDHLSVLWRVNHEEFNRRFRHQACVQLVEDKWDSDTAAVMAAMLCISRNFETKVATDISVQMSVDEVSSSVTRLLNAGDIQAPERGVGDILRSLASDPLEFVQYVGPGPGGETYQLQLYRMVDLLRLKEAQAVVRDRFGVAGLRVFTLLLMKGQLEQKQIGDFAMLPQKDTRELLYSMLKGGFLSVQDIPKTSDHAPSRTFYTWNVQPPAVYDRISAELFRAAANVRIRLQWEMEREKEVKELIDSFHDTGSISHTLTATQKEQIKRLKLVTELLESSLLRLDEMIALFNDY